MEDKSEIKKGIKHPASEEDLRVFLNETGVVWKGMSLGDFMFSRTEDSISHVTSKVNRFSNPSDLKITDMRYCVLQLGPEGSRHPIIRIDTNQGIYGLGEVRDSGDERYALLLKSRILGENPCNVEMLFKIIKQFGHHGRQGGGVSGVEMALWDLAGKAYGVPCWQLLGGRYRDKVRLYSYLPVHDGANMDIPKFKADVKHRLEEQGYTWLKFYPSLDIIQHIPGALVNSRFWTEPKTNDITTYSRTKQPFTQLQITEKGLDALAEYVDNVRNVIGYDIPLSADGFGNYDINTCIRVGQALDPFRLAWLEDMLSWEMTDQLKVLTDTLQTPVMTGEDIYLKEEFIKLCNAQAVDMIHPDLATSGGMLETKKIGDYAEEKGISMAMHASGSPVLFMANVHCAAATQNFLALEMTTQAVDNPWWQNLVITTDGRKLVEQGYGNVPLAAPGLGIELNEEEVKKHLFPPDKSYFAPTPEWDDKRAADHLWSGRYTLGQPTGIVPK
ncbi:mandelate racemase/muconate lactonizing enzyme family protein [Negadavirga shengliensis]|uniref:Mandelate racemase/muconate lactonizing enzyme family protein n=1 Tax=Negadavirga shengliensis TaxID=1389218 RepID=A0ABV9SWN0_9BACT